MKVLLIVPVLIVAFIVFDFFACSHKSSEKQIDGESLQGEISLSGAFALYPLAVVWAEEFQKIHPNVRIDVSAGGAGKGIADALSESVDLGMVSRAISPEEIKKGAWFISVTKDAVLPTISEQNSDSKIIMERGLTKNDFKKIFLSTGIPNWGSILNNNSTQKLTVFTRSDACGAAEMWARFIDSKQENLAGTGVFGDPGIAEAVKKNKGAIGYNNLIYIYDFKTRKKYPGLQVVPIDVNENGKIDASENFYESMDSLMTAVRDGRYPSPPARDLYFVSKGKPLKKATLEFLKWILLEGQKFVKEAGYVSLSNESLINEQGKLK